MNIFASIANDPNVDPALRRLFANPAPDLLERAVEKAAPRRFIDAEPSAFGALEGIGRVGSLRWRSVRGQEHADQLWDEAHPGEAE